MQKEESRAEVKKKRQRERKETKQILVHTCTERTHKWRNLSSESTLFLLLRRFPADFYGTSPRRTKLTTRYPPGRRCLRDIGGKLSQTFVRLNFHLHRRDHRHIYSNSRMFSNALFNQFVVTDDWKHWQASTFESTWNKYYLAGRALGREILYALWNPFAAISYECDAI